MLMNFYFKDEVLPYYGGGTVTATLLSREVFGTGTYKGWWDGVKDEGSYIQPSDGGSGGDYLWSAQAWRLPDNAIVIEGGRPWITNPAATPNLYWPAMEACIGTSDCDINFTLSHDAVLILQVFSMDNGNLLREMVTSQFAAGDNVTSWDGKASTGEYVAEGKYRVELHALSANGDMSYLRRVLVMVSY